MKRLKSASLLTLAGATVLFSCNSNNDLVPPTDEMSATAIRAMQAHLESLEGEWVLTNYQKNPLSPGQENKATLVLKKRAGDSLEMGGRSFVNLYGGLLTVEEAKGLVILQDGVYSTDMAGPEEAMKAEARYFADLQKATYFELTDSGQLKFYLGTKDNADTEVMLFTKK